MNQNPYTQPESQQTVIPALDVDQTSARRSVRTALLVLLLPAVYNFCCFNFPGRLATGQASVPVVFVIANSAGLIAVAAAIWFFGYQALELIVRLIHSIVARHSKFEQWRHALHVTLVRLPVFAIFGAILWVIWVAAFYQAGIGFYTISWPIGLAAHLLAAGLYVPLIYRFYRLEYPVR